jgi:hypothetical protein
MTYSHYSNAYYLNKIAQFDISNGQLLGLGDCRGQKLLQRLGDLARLDTSRNFERIGHVLEFLEVNQLEAKNMNI